MFRFALVFLLLGLSSTAAGLTRVGTVTTRIGLFLLAIEILSLAFPVIFGLLDGRRSIIWPGRHLPPGTGSRPQFPLVPGA